jgi:3'-phosphoadenosine 5'-phosphosulfate sulfotransferase (PAPS reductase)/FAD synthetase
VSDMRQYEVFAKTQAFKRHVDTARRIINESAEKGRLVVSMSWGKDSCAMGDLVHRELGHADMMHMACAHELPGGDAVSGYFEERATIHELPPLNTLAESLEWLKVVGLPHERDPRDHQRIIQTRKRDRGNDWAIDNGYACTMLGMRAEESVVRRRLFKGRGPLYQRANGHWVSNPLAWWKTHDVWSYLVSRDVPWHPLYDCETHGFSRERLRNGGWLYTDGAPDGWTVWLRAHYPHEWRRLVDAFPHMRTLSS